MGITFKDPSDELRAKQHLPPGASMVSLVFPDSAAQAAGFEVGDIVVGTPSEPFTSKNQVRQWTMLSDIGKPAKLVILRDGKRRQVSITPRPYPMKWPSLPGPMQVGSAAPKVDFERYRGALGANLHKKHILYFWATWCGPCKASLPELLAFEKVLDAFFKKFSSPFPDTIAIDELRRAFVAYGVSGTPAFVLVDEKGKVAAYQVGYDPSAGLALPEWSWSGRKVHAPGP
jgi:thiol-disulfide isomerase/thioredoxin